MDNKTSFYDHKDIDWLNIFILEELHEYLKGSDLKELSLISQLFRNKLKSFVFKYIVLEHSRLSNDIYYFGLSHNSRANLFIQQGIREYEKSELYQRSINRHNYKKLVIDPYLQSMKDEFKIYYPFAQSFKFYNAYQPCYYLINLVGLATNLTSLSVCSSFLLFKEFQIILNSSKYLKELTLKDVTFVKFQTDKLSTNELSLPKTLKKLTICNSVLIERYYRKGSYQLLFGRFSIVPITLPIDTQYLKKLEYLDYVTEYGSYTFLTKFLETNNQVKCLKVQFNNLMENNMKLIRALHNLKRLFIYFPNFKDDIFLEVDCSPLNNIEELGMSPIKSVTSLLFIKLLLACKNLKVLKLNLIGNYSIFLKNCIPQLLSLKSLYIDSRKYYTRKRFDFSSFTNISHLTVGLPYEEALNLKLYTQNKLKTIFIKFDNPHQLDIKPLVEKYKKYKGWNCIVNYEWIRCYRLN